MPAGDKSKYTKKQQRQAEHIEERYEARGYSQEEAERRAWATVNKVHSSGEDFDEPDHGREENHAAMQRGSKRSQVQRDRINRDEIEPE